ncbi:hypothetical protein U3516DRAFT_853275 [Neocallimastix sp. 'constans']
MDILDLTVSTVTKLIDTIARSYINLLDPPSNNLSLNSESNDKPSLIYINTEEGQTGNNQALSSNSVIIHYTRFNNNTIQKKIKDESFGVLTLPGCYDDLVVPPQFNPQTTFLNENDTYAITDKKLGGDDSISIGTFVVDIPNEIVMQANAIGVSRSDMEITFISIFDDEDRDYFVIIFCIPKIHTNEIYFGKINTGHDITGQQFKMMTIRNISIDVDGNTQSKKLKRHKNHFQIINHYNYQTPITSNSNIGLVFDILADHPVNAISFKVQVPNAGNEYEITSDQGYDSLTKKMKKKKKIITGVNGSSDFVTYADRHSLSFYNGNFLVIVVDKVIYRTFTRNLLCLYILCRKNINWTVLDGEEFYPDYHYTLHFKDLNNRFLTNESHDYSVGPAYYNEYIRNMSKFVDIQGTTPTDYINYYNNGAIVEKLPLNITLDTGLFTDLNAKYRSFTYTNYNEDVINKKNINNPILDNDTFFNTVHYIDPVTGSETTYIGTVSIPKQIIPEGNNILYISKFSLNGNEEKKKCIYQKYTLNKFQTYIGISGPSSEHNNISIDGKFIYINDSYYIIINNTKTYILIDLDLDTYKTYLNYRQLVENFAYTIDLSNQWSSFVGTRSAYDTLFSQAKTFEIHNGHTISGNYITNGAHSITSNNPTIGNIDFSINVATRITITSYRIDFGSKYPVYITRKINEWNVNNTGNTLLICSIISSGSQTMITYSLPSNKWGLLLININQYNNNSTFIVQSSKGSVVQYQLLHCKSL